MNKVGIQIRRYAILVHRWLGVVFCVLFAVWFISGIVMMYWSYPKVSAETRLSKSQPLDASRIRISPAQAYTQIQTLHAPDRVVITMLDGRPVYRFYQGSSQSLVYADNGERLANVPPEMSLRIASAWTRQAAASAEFQGAITDDDQWTVNPSVRTLGPFWKWSWPDGQETYISQLTGEVAQNTTRAARIEAYFGAVPHWIYFTSLRKRDSAWRAVVIWSSGVGVILTLLGLIVGVWLYSPSKRYRFPEARVSAIPAERWGWRNLIWPKGRSSIPYGGQKRWHTVLGLFFGLVTCTWTLSGMLSMNPLRWSPAGGGAAVISALRGTEWNPTRFENFVPADALRKVHAVFHPKELELMFFRSEPIYLATESPGRSAIINASGAVVPALDRQQTVEALVAGRPYPLVETRMVEQYESYYVDRHHEKPLPVLFARFGDPAGSMHYIDLRTGRVVESYVKLSRLNRWLYHGLHSMDLPWLYRHRPVWDILVLNLMLGGTALSITSVIIGWRRLRRKVTLPRPLKCVGTNNSPGTANESLRTSSRRKS